MRPFLLFLLAVGVAGLAYGLWPSTGPASVEHETTGRTASKPDPRRPRSAQASGRKETAGREGAENRVPTTQAVDAAVAVRGSGDLVVRVLDHLRRPLVGFPVCLLNQQGPLHGLNRNALASAETDSEGFAVFRSRRKDVQPSATSGIWYVVHDVHFEKQPFVELTPELLAQEWIETIQPPFGAIQIVASEQDGAQAKDIDGASLELVNSREHEDPTLAWRRLQWSQKGDQADQRLASARDWRLKLRAGDPRAFLRFDYVELGREWVAGAARKAAEVPSLARGAGPTRHGEVSRIQVKMGVGHPVAVFRILEPSGRPLANAEVRVELKQEWFGGSTMRLSTDALGRIAIDAKRDLFFQKHVSVSYERPKNGNEPGATWVGSAEMGNRLKDGKNECGDIALRPKGLVVSGTVVDQRGRPLPGIKVRASKHASYRANQPLFLLGLPTIVGETDENGAFELAGDFTLSRFKVFVDDVELRSDPKDAGPGERGVRLTAFKIVVPSIQVLVSEATGWTGVDVRLRTAGQDKGGVGSLEASREGGSIRATFGPVRQGRYDLVWSFQGKPLGRRDGIQIEKGGNIATIDLRRSLFPFGVSLFFPDGAEPKKIRGTVFWQAVDAADKSKWNALDFSKSFVNFNALSRAVNLRIFAAGYREERLMGVAGPRPVTLRPGLPVRLVLSTEGEVPKHPYIFDPYPMVEGKPVGKPIGSRYFTKTKREARFLLPAGKVVIGWHLERRAKSGAIGGTVLDRHNVTIDVKDIPGEQVFHLLLDGNALRRLMHKRAW